jgi:chromate transporter
MVQGLALAETTPGPLIMVLQYVGFLGAWRFPGDLSPLHSGILGALTTTYVTFLPSFLFIFAGAPYIEALAANRSLQGALAAVTAAVVGVILNLAVFLALKVLFPEGNAPDFYAIAVAVAAFFLLQWRHWPIPGVVALGALLGVVWTLLKSWLVALGHLKSTLACPRGSAMLVPSLWAGRGSKRRYVAQCQNRTPRRESSLMGSSS